MTISKVVGILSILIVACCIILSILISILYNTSLDSNTAFAEERILNTLANELANSSLALTRNVRLYVITSQYSAEQDYNDILMERNGSAPRKKTRAIHPYESVSLLDLMRKYGITEEELAKVNVASTLSNRLVILEEEAFNAAKGVFKDGMGQYTIRKAPDQEYALNIVFNSVYFSELNKIQKSLGEFFVMLRDRSHKDTLEASKLVYLNIVFLAFIISIVLILVLVFVWYVRYNICIPLGNMADCIKEGKEIKVKETLFFTKANEIIILEKELSKRLNKGDGLWDG